MVGLELDPNIHLDGKSMLAIWKGKSKDYRQRIFFWHFPHRRNPVSSVMEGDWKLVHTLKTNRYELFNLKTDPYEKKDLSHKFRKETARLTAFWSSICKN